MAEWSNSVRPIQWRCHWLELRMRELSSQVSKYDRELALINKQKESKQAVSKANGTMSESMQMHKGHGNSIMKRRKRKRRGDERAAACAPSPSSTSFDRDVFPVLLAAVRTTRQTSSSSSPPAALAARLLRRVLSRSPQTLSPLPRSLVALLPLLLSSRWVRVRTSQTPPPCALHPCPSEC